FTEPDDSSDGHHGCACREDRWYGRQRAASLKQQKECDRAGADTNASDDAEQHAGPRRTLIPPMCQVETGQIHANRDDGASFHDQPAEAIADSIGRQLREDLMEPVKDRRSNCVRKPRSKHCRSPLANPKAPPVPSSERTRSGSSALS